MKKFSKAFSILLVVTLLASVMVMPTFAATPALDTSEEATAQYYSFNTPSSITAGSNEMNALGSAIEVADYVVSVFGKQTYDYSLKLSATKYGVSFYRKGVIYNRSSQLGSIMQHGYEFAIPSDAATGTIQSYRITKPYANGDSATGKIRALSSTVTPTNILSFVKGAEGNTIKVLDEFEATLTWRDDTWYSVDVYITKGDATHQSYMTIYVDGMPLTLKDGKTLDGVKTTTQNFLIDADSATDGIQGFTGYALHGVEILFADIASGCAYLDNVQQYIYASTNEAYLNENRKTYEYASVVNTDFSDDSCTQDPLIMDTTKNVAGPTVDGNRYYSLKNSASPRIWILGSKTATASGFDRVSFSLDVRSTTANAYKMYLKKITPSQSSLGTLLSNESKYGWAVGRDADLGINTADELSALDNKWIPMEMLINVNNDSYVINAFGAPQFTVPKSIEISGKDYLCLNITSSSDDSPLDIDNMKISLQNYYPVIKSLACDSATATNHASAVSTETSSIVAHLDGRIAVTDQTNIDKIKIVAVDGTEIPADVAYDASANTLTFSDISGLAGTTVYNIVFPANLALSSTANMEQAYQYSFKTDYAPFCVKSVQFMVKPKATEANPAPSFAPHSSGYVGDSATVGAQVKMNNTSGEDKSYTAILAVYDANEILTNLEPVPIIVGADGTTNATFDFNGITLANTSGAIIKVYLWDDMDNIMPLTDSFYLWQNISGGSGGDGTPYQER